MKRILFILISLYIGILAAQAANIPHLLPWPQKVAWNGKKFQYRGTFVSLTENFCSIGMEQPAGNKITGNPSSHPALSVKWVEDFPDIPLNRNEAYKLRVTSKGVEIEAITETGVYRAIQTLRQLTEKNPLSRLKPGYETSQTFTLLQSPDARSPTGPPFASAASCRM